MPGHFDLIKPVQEFAIIRANTAQIRRLGSLIPDLPPFLPSARTDMLKPLIRKYAMRALCYTEIK